MKNAKILLLVILAALIVNTGIAPAHAVQKMSIAEIREEVKDGWHQTYDTNRETVVVDIEFSVPDVEVVPAIEVGYPANFQPNLPSNGSIAFDESNGFHGFSYDVVVDSIYWAGIGEPRMLFEPGARAENSPMSQEEANDFFVNEINQYSAVIGSDFEQKFIIPFSREYFVVSKEDYIHEIDLNQPLTDMGYYWLSLYQMFHGIPYLVAGVPRYVPQTGELVEPPRGRIEGYVATSQDYSITLEPAVKLRIIADSLPLAPFSKVKTAFEERINAGYIREVHEVKFGYMAYQNPDNLGTTFILLPVWVLYGNMVQRPNDEDYPTSPWGVEFEKVSKGQMLVVNAQTGELIDPDDGRETRDYAAMINW